MPTLAQLVAARFDRAATSVRIEQRSPAVWRVTLRRRHIGWIVRYLDIYVVSTAPSAQELTWSAWRSHPHNQLWLEPRHGYGFDHHAVLGALLELDGGIDLPAQPRAELKDS